MNIIFSSPLKVRLPSSLDKMEQNGNSMCNNYSQINFHYNEESVMYENQDRNCSLSLEKFFSNTKEND